MDTTQDAFLGGKVTLSQPKRGFRAGVDSVFLAASIPAKAGEHVLEAGIGPGVAAMCLLARLPDVEVSGAEIQSDIAELARQNAATNGFAQKLTVEQGDVTERPAPFIDQQFDHAYANPPYFDAGAALTSPHASRTTSHFTNGEDYAAFIDYLVRRVKSGGSVTLVQRAENLPETMAALTGRVGALTLYPLWPRAGAEAKLFLLQGKKGARSPFKLAPGMVLHEADNSFTPQAQAILRHGAALTLG